MASVILHFAFPDRYPMLDKRVMRVVGAPAAYSFDRWVEYTELAGSAARSSASRARPKERRVYHERTLR